MTMMSLMFEALVAVALVLAAIQCWRLDRRLSALRNGQDGVAKSILALAEATQRAEASVRQLRAAGEEAGRELEERIVSARALADELNLLGAGRPTPRMPTRVFDEEPAEEPRPRARAAAKRRAALGPNTRASESHGVEPRDEEAAAQAVALLNRLRGVR